MPIWYLRTVDEARHVIVTNCLDDTSETAHKAIYFDGWDGLAASHVLRDMADNPPSSLRKKFDKIIHIDCLRWKSRRALQKAIVEKLELPQWVSAALDRQDVEDDFNGIHIGSRQEMANVAGAIYQSLMYISFLVIFHNGSDHSMDLADFGIPRHERFSGIVSRILWTFRGRFHLDPKIKEKVDSSNLIIEAPLKYLLGWDVGLEQEAREIARLCPGADHRITKKCCLYLLLLNHDGENIVDYNWATHASNYWVCDGIVKGDQHNNPWEVARAVHRQIRIEDYSFNNTTPTFATGSESPLNHWVLASNTKMEHKLPCPNTTSFFLGYSRSGSDNPLTSLPNKMFHQAGGLRVLKLCRCTFNFSPPPFHCCHNLRFLGLDSCVDSAEQTLTFIPPKEDCCTDQQRGERSKYGPAFEVFQRLWVLDMCHTDWELASPLGEGEGEGEEEKIATNIREVHIRKGRIWHNNLPWRKLQNLHKLCIVEPTRPWETGKKDEFKDTVTLEYLHLSDSTIQVLPSFSGATRLKTVVLDGCIGLERIGPQGLPPLLESLCMDAGAGKDSKKKSKISCINLAGCSRLTDFTLRGPLPKLEECWAVLFECVWPMGLPIYIDLYQETECSPFQIFPNPSWYHSQASRRRRDCS